MLITHNAWKAAKTRLGIPKGVTKHNMGKLLDEFRAVWNQNDSMPELPPYVDKLRAAATDYRISLNKLIAKESDAAKKTNLKKFLTDIVEAEIVKELDALDKIFDTAKVMREKGQKRLDKAKAAWKACKATAESCRDDLAALADGIEEVGRTSKALVLALQNYKDDAAAGPEVTKCTASIQKFVTTYKAKGATPEAVKDGEADMLAAFTAAKEAWAKAGNPADVKAALSPAIAAWKSVVGQRSALVSLTAKYKEERKAFLSRFEELNSQLSALIETDRNGNGMRQTWQLCNAARVGFDNGLTSDPGEINWPSISASEQSMINNAQAIVDHYKT